MPGLFSLLRLLKRNSSVLDPEEFRAPLVDHLEELRTRIVRSLVFLVAGWVAGWFIEPWLYRTIDALVRSSIPKHIQYTDAFHSITEPFFFRLKLSFAIGIALAIPFIVLQLWGFIAPGLKPNERKPIQLAAPVSVLLFALGCFVCWQVLPPAFEWFAGYLDQYPNTQLIQKPQEIVFFTVKMITSFGVGFQLPIIVFVLAKVGILGPDTLKQYWRHSIVIIFFASAALTPSGDPISLMMMAVPLTILFLLSIMAVTLTSRPKKEDLEAEVVDSE